MEITREKKGPSDGEKSWKKGQGREVREDGCKGSKKSTKIFPGLLPYKMDLRHHGGLAVAFSQLKSDHVL